MEYKFRALKMNIILIYYVEQKYKYDYMHLKLQTNEII